MNGDLQAWRARRIADRTLLLSPEAADFVDRHLDHFAHKIRPSLVDRLIDEAIARFMPALAEEQRQAAADRRCFEVDTREVTLAGTTRVYGELDLADALDLDAAVANVAAQLGDLGSTDVPRRPPRGRRR